MSVSKSPFKEKKLALSGASGKVMYGKDMGSCKAAVQTKRTEPLGRQNHSPVQCGLRQCNCWTDHHSWLAAAVLETIGGYATPFPRMNPSSLLLSVGSPSVRIPGGAPSKGARKTDPEPLASLLGGGLCPAPRSVDYTIPQT